MWLEHFQQHILQTELISLKTYNSLGENAVVNRVTYSLYMCCVLSLIKLSHYLYNTCNNKRYTMRWKSKFLT